MICDYLKLKYIQIFLTKLIRDLCINFNLLDKSYRFSGLYHTIEISILI